jgi:hypothetical protein
MKTVNFHTREARMSSCHDNINKKNKSPVNIYIYIYERWINAPYTLLMGDS